MAKWEKQINLLNTTRTTSTTSYTYTADRNPLFYYDSGVYDAVTAVYLEANIKTGNGADTVYAALYTTGDSFVTGSAVTTSSTSFVLARSGDILSALSNGTTYRVKWMADNGSGGAPAATASINGVKLIIVQSGTITKTETIIELGERNGLITTYGELSSDTARFLFESGRFDGTVVVYLEADLKSDNASYTAYCQLYDIDAAAAVSGSEVSHTGNTVNTRKRSGALTLTNGHNYRLESKGSTSSVCDLVAGKIIIQQSGTITKTDCYLPILNTTSGSGNTSYTGQDRFFEFDYSNFTGDTVVYYHEYSSRNASGAGTNYYKIVNETDAGDITGSIISLTSSTRTRIRSGALTMPTTDNKLLNSYQKVDSGTSTGRSRSFLIVQIDWSSATSDIKKLIGITQANLKLVTGVTNANIKKIIEVANS